MTNGKSAANRVLASIPSGEGKRLRSQLEPVTVNFGQVLYEPGKAIQHVCFPVDCLISLLTAVDKRRKLIAYSRGNIQILDGRWPEGPSPDGFSYQGNAGPAPSFFRTTARARPHDKPPRHHTLQQCSITRRQR